MTPSLARYKANLLLNDYRGICKRAGKPIETIPAELFHLVAMAGHEGMISRDKVRYTLSSMINGTYT